jgi:hypothetical protein
MLRYALPLLGFLTLPLTPVWAAETAQSKNLPDAADTATAARRASDRARARAPMAGSGEGPAAGQSGAGPKDTIGGKSPTPNQGQHQGAAVPQTIDPPSALPVVDAAAATAATAIAIAYLTTLKEKGFGAAPPYLHATAMARFKTLAMPGLKDEQARGMRNLLNATFGREATYATAVTADPADFLTRFARLIAAREPDAAPIFSRLTPLGVVAEGEQLHVLVRLGLDGGGAAAGSPAVERVEVVSLLPQGQDWKVLLDGRLQDLAHRLGSRARADERRGGLPRLEPLPEGLAPLPAAPQGPASPLSSLPVLPGVPR